MYRLEEGAKCAVIGYGSWATALVKILLESEKRVGWYISKQDVIDHILETKRNPRYLDSVRFDTDKLDLSNDINRTVRECDIIILAVPSAFLVQTLEPLTEELSRKFVISAIKGIIPSDEYLTIAEYINQRYKMSFDQIGIVTGPCHSEEVAYERLSYLTMVCKSIENAEILCKKFANRYIIANTSTDIYGAEYAAVLKNVYAIAAGMSLGLGYGDNFLAVLISNAAIEMNRFITQSYPTERDTAKSAAYLGDLLVTCYSQFSRNRMFGAMIGRGNSVKSAMNLMNMIAEGYYASECIMQVNKRFGLDMPIADSVHRVLYEGRPVASEMKLLSKKLL